jgi:hypothetical protein
VRDPAAVMTSLTSIFNHEGVSPLPIDLDTQIAPPITSIFFFMLTLIPGSMGGSTSDPYAFNLETLGIQVRNLAVVLTKCALRYFGRTVSRVHYLSLGFNLGGILFCLSSQAVAAFRTGTEGRFMSAPIRVHSETTIRTKTSRE